MKSLRLRLVVTLCLAIAVVWSTAAAWMFGSMRHELQNVLDDRLVASTRMVAGIVSQFSQAHMEASSQPGQHTDLTSVIARDGDNLCARGDRLAWWEGPTLVEALDALEPPASDAGGTLLAVQWVARQAGGGRALAGTLRGGALSVGDRMRLAGGTGAFAPQYDLSVAQFVYARRFVFCLFCDYSGDARPL